MAIDWESAPIRRLPVYVLVDRSGSMAGAKIAAVSSGLEALRREMLADPRSVHMVYVSIITFADGAHQTPLAPVTQLSLPALTAGGATELGAALRLLNSSLDRDLIPNSPTRKEDYKPLVFLLTDGAPTDSWEEEAQRLTTRTNGKPAAVLALAVGEDADVGVLHRITPLVFATESGDVAGLEAFFQWTSASVKAASLAAHGVVAPGQEPQAQLPAPPPSLMFAPEDVPGPAPQVETHPGDTTSPQRDGSAPGPVESQPRFGSGVAGAPGAAVGAVAGSLGAEGAVIDGVIGAIGAAKEAAQQQQATEDGTPPTASASEQDGEEVVRGITLPAELGAATFAAPAPEQEQTGKDVPGGWDTPTMRLPRREEAPLAPPAAPAVSPPPPPPPARGIDWGCPPPSPPPAPRYAPQPAYPPTAGAGYGAPPAPPMPPMPQMAPAPQPPGGYGYPGQFPAPGAPQPGMPGAPAAVAEQVMFTAYHLKEIAPLAWEPLYVYIALDTPQAQAQVGIAAQQALAGRADQFRPAQAAQSSWLRRGTQLTLVPNVPGFQFNPGEMTVTWEEDVQQQLFRMQAATARPGLAVNGSIQVFTGPLLRAEIPISLFVRQAGMSTQMSQSFASIAVRAYRKVFASYSHKDTAVVESCETAAEVTGDRYLRDVTLLRSGEQWDPRLLQAIGEADLFQLFWSEHAAQSRAVATEWRHALALQPGRGNFIRPVYWSKQPYAIPPELQAIHFERLSLARLGWGKARIFFHNVIGLG